MESYVIRDATKADLAALTRVRNDPVRFAEYLNTADGDGIRFLVYEVDDELFAFGMLFLRQPSTGRRKSRIPMISDLYVALGARSMGIGSTVVGHMEKLAAAYGHAAMYLGVDAEDPRVMAFYERLGYAPLCDEPRRRTAAFYDEHGHRTVREYWRLDLAKPLTVR